jgi:hypothetical protein
MFFNIIPWIEHAHGRDITWWYHVRMAIENLPVHAWNLEVLKEALGEFCLFDKIDRATYRQQASDTLYCWAWMWIPDFLPRAKRVTIFDHGAGQAPLAAGGVSSPGMCLRPRGARAMTSSSTSTWWRIGGHHETAPPALDRVGCPPLYPPSRRNTR